MLPISNPIKKHLIRIKYLLEVGLTPHLSRNSEADNVVAVIILDYCVESLLKTVMTAAAVSSPKSGDIRFPELWTLINDKVIKEKRFGIVITELPFRNDLKNLHGQRNGTQHEGVTPHATDVEKYVVLVREFVQQIYRDVFGQDYDSLTLIDLVQNENLRELLTEAEALLKAGESLQSAMRSAEAMMRLMMMSSSYTPLQHPENLVGITNELPGQAHRAVSKIVKAIEQLREGLTRQMQIVMGLGFKDYARYQHFAPIVNITLDGKAHFSFFKKDLTPEDSKWLLDYVLGNVLRMEEAGLEWHTLG